MLQFLPDFLRHNQPFVPTQQPRWRWLGPLLVAGFVLRLFLAFNTNLILRPDEQVQYLEQAHRVVFGYGIVPWEYRVGARNWMIASPAIFALYLAKFFGIEQPWNYVPIVKTIYVSISMLLPLSMYHLVRRLSTEMAGRAAMLLGLFWFELLAYAHRPLAEPLATTLFVAGLALARTDAGLLRLGLCGVLLGTTVAIRIAYAPLCLFAGVVLLLNLSHRQQLVVGGGSIIAILCWGLIDKLTWGSWWESLFVYAKFHAALIEKPRATAVLEWGYTFYLPALVMVSGLVFGITLIISLFQPRKHWFLFGLFLCFLLPHAAYFPAEYSNAFVAGVILLCLSATVWGEKLTQVSSVTDWPWRQKLGGAGAVFVSLLGISGTHPFLGSANLPQQLFNHDAELNLAIDYLARRPDAEIKSVLLLCSNLALSGGYYRLHKYIPVFETRTPAANPIELTPAGTLLSRRQDGVLIAQPPTGIGEPLENVISHIVSCDHSHFANFKVVSHGKHYRILANHDLALVRAIEPLFDSRLDLHSLVETELYASGELVPKEFLLRRPATL